MSSEELEYQAKVKKLELECEKLKLEISQLKKKWWKKASTWAIVLPVVAGIATGGFQLAMTMTKLNNAEIKAKQHVQIGKTLGTENENLTTEQQQELAREAELRRNALEFIKK